MRTSWLDLLITPNQLLIYKSILKINSLEEHGRRPLTIVASTSEEGCPARKRRILPVVLWSRRRGRGSWLQSAKAPKPIVVAGDVVIDWLNWPEKAVAPATDGSTPNWKQVEGTRWEPRRGGAWLLTDLLKAAVGDPNVDVIGPAEEKNLRGATPDPVPPFDRRSPSPKRRTRTRRRSPTDAPRRSRRTARSCLPPQRRLPVRSASVRCAAMSVPIRAP